MKRKNWTTKYVMIPMERARCPEINGIPVKLDKGIETVYSNKLSVTAKIRAFL
jgi:hypothetical protein